MSFVFGIKFFWAHACELSAMNVKCFASSEVLQVKKSFVFKFDIKNEQPDINIVNQSFLEIF